MKFEEKLIKLRKENMLSQEELGEKLNVTRQTISKWELGQTKPDSEKIMEMAKIFNISVDELLNEEEPIKTKQKQDKDKNNNRRNTIIVISLIIVLLVVIVGVVCKIGHDSALNNANISNTSNNGGFFGKVTGFISDIYNQIQKEREDIDERKDDYDEKFNKASNEFNEIYEKVKNDSEKFDEEFKENEMKIQRDNHNGPYEIRAGVNPKSTVEFVINDVIKDNGSGDKKVVVNYQGITYAESGELANLLSSLNQSKKYLITLEYDEEGYVNKVNLADT